MAADPLASAADPPLRSDPALLLVARLAEEFRLSTAEQLRLYQLQAALARNSVEAGHPNFARWLSPVFCSSPDEQARFLALCEELAAELPRPRPALPIWRDESAPGRQRTPSARTAPLPPAREVDEVEQRRRRDIIILALIGSAMLVAVGLVLVLIGGQVIPVPGTVPPSTPLPPPSSRLAQKILEVAAGWGLKLKIGPWALLGLIPLVVGLLLSAWLIGRLRREQRAFRPKPEVSRPIALRSALDLFFHGEDVRRSILSLARHRLVPGARLHIHRTLRATIRNAGFPTPRFGARPTVPGYLLLIDRESPRDHLPLVGEILARRLRQQFATVTRFAFHHSPKLLVDLDHPGRRRASLSELTSLLPGARVMVLAEADRLVRPTGKAVEWLNDLGRAGHVTLLDPRAESDWAEDEAALRRAGFALLPATRDGIRRFAEGVTAGSAIHAPPPSEPARLDLPFQLSRHRALLLSDEPLDDDLLEGLIRDLEEWLGSDLMRLLCALAVFPRLEPPLTLALGKTLKTADGERLLTDDTLLTIVRLPWLRAGRMPDQLRGRLARTLSRKDLRMSVRMVHAFLVAEVEALRLGVSRPPRRPDLLAHWLRESKDSDLHDDILIDAVEGRHPEKLGTAPDPGLLVRLRRAAGSPALVSSLAAVIAALVVMWLQPLYEKRPTPVPTARGPAEPPQPNGVPTSAASPAATGPAEAEIPAQAVPPPVPVPAAGLPVPASAPVRTAPDAASSQRPGEVLQAQILGKRALARLEQLPANDFRFRLMSSDLLKDAIARGDVDAIQSIDSQTQDRLKLYSGTQAGESKQDAPAAQQQPPDVLARSRTFVVPFEDGGSTLTAASLRIVRQAASFVREHDVTEVQLTIKYGDGPPPLEDNQANLVADALIDFGVRSSLIVVISGTSRSTTPIAFLKVVELPAPAVVEIRVVYKLRAMGLRHGEAPPSHQELTTHSRRL